MCSISPKKHFHAVCVGVNENSREQSKAFCSSVTGTATWPSFSNIPLSENAMEACIYFILTLG